MHGEVKFYTGRAVDARRYIEADNFGADDYYLGEGSGVADRYVVSGSKVEAGAGDRCRDVRAGAVNAC